MIYFDFSDSLALAFGLCLVAAWWAGRCRSELWNTAAVVAGAAVMGFSFVFSFRRSFWLGLAAGLAVLAWRAPWSERRRLAALAAASVLGIAVVIGGVRAVQPLVAATPAGALDSQVRAVGQRVASIANTTSEPTNRFRVFDTLNATNAVLKSSGLGAGFGSRYDVVWSDEQQREFLEHVSRLSHNTYLYLAMKMGVLGLIAWAWLFCELLVQVLASRAGSSMRAVTEAVAATLVTAGVAALFMPLAYNVRPMVLLALTCGLGLAAARDVESVG
jgi:O-antigen ligase